ncbi:MAG: hypothetical protein V4541_01115 [Bacteroidota bacterium]
MKDENKKEIQDAFQNASLALRSLEEVIRKYYNTPKENLNIKEFKKIQFPPNYIRTKYHFVQQYNLNVLITDKIKIASIAYSLMQSDLHNYILNRVHIWGIVEGFFFKSAIINLVSIIEALILCSISKQHTFCTTNNGKTVCKFNGNCKFYIKSAKHMKVKEAIEYFKDKYFNGNLEIYDDLIHLNRIRNNVHISILEEHEFESKDYCFESYNKAIRVLLYLKENQYKVMQEYHIHRNNGCEVLPF